MAANGSVSFEALGKSHLLRFGINALCELEDETGVGVDQLGAQLGKGMKLSFARACFWAGLRDQAPDLTLGDAGRIMDEIGIAEVGELLGAALKAAFPEGQKTAGNPPKPRGGAKAGTTS